MTSCIKSALTLLHSNHVLKIQKMFCGCSLRISKRLSTNSLWSSSNSLRWFSNFLRLCSCLGIAEGHLQATQEDNQSDSCEYLHFLLSQSGWSLRLAVPLLYLQLLISCVSRHYIYFPLPVEDHALIIDVLMSLSVRCCFCIIKAKSVRFNCLGNVILLLALTIMNKV